MLSRCFSQAARRLSRAASNEHAIRDLFDTKGTWSLSSLLPSAAETAYELPISLEDLSDYAALPVVDANAIERDVRQIFSLAEHLDGEAPHCDGSRTHVADVVISRQDLLDADACDEREWEQDQEREERLVDGARAERAKGGDRIITNNHDGDEADIDDGALPRESLLAMVPKRFVRDPYIIGK